MAIDLIGVIIRVNNIYIFIRLEYQREYIRYGKSFDWNYKGCKLDLEIHLTGIIKSVDQSALVCFECHAHTNLYSSYFIAYAYFCIHTYVMPTFVLMPASVYVMPTLELRPAYTVKEVSTSSTSKM